MLFLMQYFYVQYLNFYWRTAEAPKINLQLIVILHAGRFTNF